MVRNQLCEKPTLKKGAWSPEEDQKLTAYIKRCGIWNWTEMPKPAGLLRSGKSYRLRWVNYLRLDIKRGNFTGEEEEIILKMHEMLGNKWSVIAAALPGITDNKIKNHWHTHMKKRSQEPVTRSNQNITLPELNLLLPIAPESSDGSRNILVSPSLGPAVGIIEDHDIGPYIGLETSGELQSLWGQPLSVEDLYMENIIDSFVDPGFVLPHSELWFPEPTSPYGFYIDVSSDLGGVKEPNVHF